MNIFPWATNVNGAATELESVARGMRLTAFQQHSRIQEATRPSRRNELAIGMRDALRELVEQARAKLERIEALLGEEPAEDVPGASDA